MKRQQSYKTLEQSFDRRTKTFKVYFEGDPVCEKCLIGRLGIGRSTLGRKKIDIMEAKFRINHGNAGVKRKASEKGTIWSNLMSNEFAKANVHPVSGKKHMHVPSKKAAWKILSNIIF